MFFAVITLGSNSFSLIIAELINQKPKVVARFKRKILIAQGFEKGFLTDKSIETGLECLRFFC